MNKKYFWLFILPLFLLLFIPKDTHALTVINPTIEIYGYDSSNNLVMLGGCTSCNEDGATNTTGKPSWVRVYIPRNLISSYYTYTISMSFQWKTSTSLDLWPNKPVLIFNNNYVNGVTDLSWSNFSDVIDGLERVRQNNYTFSFTADSSNLLLDYYVDIVFPNPNNLSYPLSFSSLGIDIITSSGSGTFDDFDVIIDNSKNDIINNQNNNQHQTNIKLDDLKETNLSIWDTIKEILSTLFNLPVKIGEKIGELLSNLSIWDTISNIYNFIIDIPRRIGETFRNLLETLFIPSDGFYEETIDKYYDDITNSLGMLWFPFDFIENFISKYVALETNPIINIPNIKDPVYGVTLIEARSFNIQEIFQHGAIGTVYDIYMVFAGAFIVVLFINFLIRKFNHIINGNESDVA